MKYFSKHSVTEELVPDNYSYAMEQHSLVERGSGTLGAKPVLTACRPVSSKGQGPQLHTCPGIQYLSSEEIL